MTPHRLSIAHLLLWTTYTALALAALAPAEQRWKRWSDAEEGAAGTWIVVVLLAVALLCGAGLVGVTLTLWHRFGRGAPFPTQPGHWLLLACGMLAIAPLGMAAAARPTYDNVGEGLVATLACLQVSMAICSAFLLYIASAREETPVEWSATLRLFSAGIGLSAPFLCVMLVGLAIPAIFGALFSLGVTVVSDLAGDSRYDVFHWAGVVCIVGFAATAIGLVGVMLFP